MAAQDLPTVLILGHSFVQRMSHFLTRIPQYKIPPSSFSADFHLRKVCSVRMLGIGGRTIEKVIRMDLETIRTLSSKHLVLELGSNNLCDRDWPPEAIGEAILAFVELLWSDLQLEHVMLCKIITRQRQPYPQYNDRVAALNSFLTEACKLHPHVTVWQHRGLVNPSINIFLTDGMHLNKIGTKALYKSYRRAILLSLKQVNLSSE